MKIKKWNFTEYLFIISLLIVSGVLYFIPFWNDNNQAILYVQQKKYEQAKKKWLTALQKDSFSVFYRMNLALNYMLLKQPKKAIQEYATVQKMISTKELSQEFTINSGTKKSAKSLSQDAKLNSGTKEFAKSLPQDAKLNSGIKEFAKSLPQDAKLNSGIKEFAKSLSQDTKLNSVTKKSAKHSSKNKKQYSLKDTILFYSLFNSAIAAHQNKDIKNTLSFYQQALALRPQSLEVKTNIELLIKKSEQNKKGKEGKKESDKSDKGKKESDKSDKGKKESDKSKKGKKESDKSGKDKQEAEQKHNTGKQKSEKNKEKQKLNSLQKEAILKSILDQENKIRQRRNQQQRRATPRDKDW